MITLNVNEGIPRRVLLMMSVVGGLTVANLYYNQPLLEEMKHSLHTGEMEANLITVITQVGYALGLLLIVPMADMWSRRRIILTSMVVAIGMAAVIAVATDVRLVWAASVLLGLAPWCRRYSYLWLASSRVRSTSHAIWDSCSPVCSRECLQPGWSVDILVDGWVGV